MLPKIKHSFEGENLQTQYSKLGYMINLSFHDYKLATETVENGTTTEIFTMK